MNRPVQTIFHKKRRFFRSGVFFCEGFLGVRDSRYRVYASVRETKTRYSQSEELFRQ